MSVVGAAETLDQSCNVTSSNEEPIDADCGNDGEIVNKKLPVKRFQVSVPAASKPRSPDDLLHISEDGLLCCKKCDYKTAKKGNWYKHKLKHKDRQYPCTLCPYTASTSSNMKRHMLAHEGIKNFQCDQCDAKFQQKIHLSRHVKYKHEKRRFQCTYCDYISATVQPDLVAHIRKKHADLCNVDKSGKIIPCENGASPLDMLMKFKCDQCNLYTISRKDLQQHMKFHQKGSELKFFCELCSFVTESESRLKRHVLSHTKEKPFHCGLCDYRANEAEHVKRHLRKKHSITTIPRKRRKSSKPSDAMTSNATTSDVSPLVIGQNRKISTSDVRNSEKHFACNFCTMKFTKLINLFKHVHVQHQQAMPQGSRNSCVVCDYTSTCYKRLLVHMRKMHSTTNLMNTPQKQVYVCMLCEYSSPYRLYLHAHMKKEHNMNMIADKEGVNKYMLDASKHSSMVVQNTDDAELQKPGSIIKRMKTSVVEQVDPPKDSKMVLVQLTPDGPMTPVFISMGENDSATSSLLNVTDEYPMMGTGIMDGATLGIDISEDNSLGTVSISPLSLATSTTVTSTVTVSTSKGDTANSQVDLADILVNSAAEPNEEGEEEGEEEEEVEEEEQEVEEEIFTDSVKCESEVQVVQNVSDSLHLGSDSGDSGEDEDSEKTEQVVHVSSGDIIEINGQIYKIEMEDTEEQKNIRSTSVIE